MCRDSTALICAAKPITLLVKQSFLLTWVRELLKRAFNWAARFKLPCSVTWQHSGRTRGNMGIYREPGCAFRQETAQETVTRQAYSLQKWKLNDNSVSKEQTCLTRTKRILVIRSWCRYRTPQLTAHSWARVKILHHNRTVTATKPFYLSLGRSPARPAFKTTAQVQGQKQTLGPREWWPERNVVLPKSVL